MEYNQVSFTQESLERFKQKFNETKKTNEHYFFFEENEYFIGYAKYLIEHLENQFNPLKSEL
jgi:hypothetical protein